MHLYSNNKWFRVRSFRWSRAALGSLITLAGFILASTVSAAEYSVDNDISLTGRFDDNSRLSIGFKDELYGAVLSNNTNLARATENSNFTVGLDLGVNEYNIDAFSTFDQLLDVGYFRNTERGSWSINGRVDRGSSRDTEDTESGVGIFDLQRTRVTSNELNFSLSNNLNLTNLLVWNTSVNTVQYDNDRRADYKYGSSSLLWQYILTQRFRLQATAAYSLLDSTAGGDFISPIFRDFVELGFAGDQIQQVINQCEARVFPGVPFGSLGFVPCFERRDFDNEQATTRLQTGIYYLVSERLTLDLLVGQSYVDTDSETIYPNLPVIGTAAGVRTSTTSSSNKGLTYTASLNHVMENVDTNFRVSSSNTVNSNGILVLTTTADLDSRWTINSRHSIYNSLLWFEQENSSRENTFFNDRVMLRWRFQYKYRFTNEWSGSFNYRVQEQRRSDQNREAYRNSWSLTLAWRPTTLKWSR